MSDVFVSYKAEDRSRVEPLVDALEAEGLSVWWDARVGGGEAWREAITEQLDAAGCVIVVWSKRSTGPEGRFVRDEASRAQRLGTYLPVTIDKVAPPLGFGEMQALPLTGWKGGVSDPRYRAVSEGVHSMLGRAAPAAVERTGSVRLSRRAALAAGGGAIALAAGAGTWLLVRPTGAKANTIAVLPFANLSGDSAQAYFSDGIAEEVRSALAAIAGLQVVARTSSEMLRTADAQTAARRLNVGNVVTGSVRRSPSTVRVSAQLVDGDSGMERWSETFDRPFGDILQIQSDIAASVARALSLRLSKQEQTSLVLGGTKNPEAQDLLLQARAIEGEDDSAAMLRRIDLFDRAIQLDPNYAEAYARKALQQSTWAATWAANNAEKFRVQARAVQAAKRAVEIAPKMAAAYSALGSVYQAQLSMKRSMAPLAQSVELPGTDSVTMLVYGITLSRYGRHSEAQSMIDQAIGLDPLNPLALTFKEWALYFSRQYADAIEAGREALKAAPTSRRARSLLAWSYLFLGRMDDAMRELQLVPADDYRRIVGDAAIAARTGRRVKAISLLQLLRKDFPDTSNYQFGQIYSQLGDKDQAIGALEEAWRTRDSGLTSARVDPFLDPVRPDPRFQAIVRRVFSN